MDVNADLSLSSLNIDLSLSNLNIDLKLELVKYLYKYRILLWLKLLDIDSTLYPESLYVLRKDRYILNSDEVRQLKPFISTPIDSIDSFDLNLKEILAVIIVLLPSTYNHDLSNFNEINTGLWGLIGSGLVTLVVDMYIKINVKECRLHMTDILCKFRKVMWGKYVFTDDFIKELINNNCYRSLRYVFNKGYKPNNNLIVETKNKTRAIRLIKYK